MKATSYKFFDKLCIRTLATLFMFVGVLLFLLPYFTGSLSNGRLLLILGALVAVGCGILRCFLVDGECNEDKAAGYPRQR
jgi:drug/metabolite transporter (DMT)-like permease